MPPGLAKPDNCIMPIVFDHTIVPADDKEEAAAFLARIFDLTYNGPSSHFAAVAINDELALDFDTDTCFVSQHYVFKAGEADVDEREGLPYGEPGSKFMTR